MKTITLFGIAFILFSCIPTKSISQVTEAWTQFYNFNAASWKVIYDFKTDNIGNSYALGIDDDSIPQTILLKYDQYGNQVWSIFRDSSIGRRMIFDPVGNIIFASWYHHFPSIDTSWVEKIDTDGNQIWRIKISNNWDPTDIATDHLGNIFLLSDLNIWGDPICLTKLSSSGNLLWRDTFHLGIVEDFGPYLMIDKDNSVRVVTEKFDVLKIDSNGGLTWQINIPGQSSLYGYKAAIAIDNKSNVFICGATTPDNWDNSDFTLCMIDSNGTIAWKDTLAGDHNFGLIVIPFTNYVASISLDSSLSVLHFLKYTLSGNLFYDHVIDTNTFKLFPTAYALDAYNNIYLDGFGLVYPINQGCTVMKIDSDGNFIWNIHHSPGYFDSNDYEHPLISLDQDNNIYCGTAGSSSLMHNDISIVKYVQGTTGINSPTSRSSLKIFPNPGESEITLDLNGLYIESYRIQVSDFTGTIVEERKTDFANNPFITLSTGQLQSGVYIISIISGEKNFHAKWVKL